MTGSSWVRPPAWTSTLWIWQSWAEIDQAFLRLRNILRLKKSRHTKVPTLLSMIFCSSKSYCLDSFWKVTQQLFWTWKITKVNICNKVVWSMSSSWSRFGYSPIRAGFLLWTWDYIIVSLFLQRHFEKQSIFLFPSKLAAMRAQTSFWVDLCAILSFGTPVQQSTGGS